MKQTQLAHSAHKASTTKHPVCYLANNITTPENIGSLFRTADALGIEKIYLSGNSAKPPQSKIRKTSRSADKYVAFSYEEKAINIVDNLKARGYLILGLEITNRSVSLLEFKCAEAKKLCLVLGDEKYGICDPLLELCDATIHIPMLGVNSSMNVAVACGIASFEIIRQLSTGQGSTKLGT